MVDLTTNTVGILVLGDGDCTFSASLSIALHNSVCAVSSSTSCRYELVVTCFDSKEDVLLKYPFSIKAMQLLEALPTPSSSMEIVEGRLLFGVNATASLGPLLRSDAERDRMQRQVFEHVIFNFPHIGKEDCHLHAALLKHILYRAKEVLEEDGSVYISLADGQAVSWQLYQAASEQELQVVREISFNQESWPGYETRRHQSGKSFNSRVESSVCYLLKRRNSSYEESKDIFTFAMKCHKLSRFSISSEKKKRTNEKYCGVEGEGRGSRVNSKIYKKRKIIEDTKHLVEVISESPCLYKCKKCMKAFNILRAVQTHVYQIHVLTETKTSVDNNNDDFGARRYYCEKCNGREFPNKDALMQHQRARHVGLKSTTENNKLASMDVGNFHCTVCGMGFNTEQERDTHVANGITPLSLKDTAKMEVICDTCNKRFKDERGLTQHSMSCRTLTVRSDISIHSSHLPCVTSDSS